MEIQDGRVFKSLMQNAKDFPALEDFETIPVEAQS